MRVIKADDLEPAFACVPPGREVIRGIDQELRCRLFGDVPRPHGLDDLVAASKQQTAALVRRGLTRMRDDRTSYFELRTYKLSTAMAMPMPPPMHSDATP